MDKVKTEQFMRQIIETVREEISRSNEILRKEIRDSLELKDKNLLNHKEAAKYLDIEESYLYQLNHRGHIKPIRTMNRKKNLYRKSDLQAYLMDGHKASDKEYNEFEQEIEKEWTKK